MNHLVGLWISAFQLSPSMNVEWLLKLITEVLSFLLLLKVLFLKQIDFSLKIWNARSFILRNIKLSLKIRDVFSDGHDIIESLLVIDFTLLKSTLLNLYLLVKKSKFFVSFNQLGTKDVSLVDDHLVIFSLFLFFRFGFTDDVLKPGDVTFLSFYHFLRGFDISWNFSDVHVQCLILRIVFFLLLFFRNNGLILRPNFFFKMGDLLSHSSELHFQFGNFFLCFKKILGVEISIGPYGFVQSLLLLKSTFSFNILLLKLGDQIILKLNLFQTLIVLSISLRCFNTVLLLVFLQLMDQLL